MRMVSDFLDADALDLLPAAVMDVGTFAQHDVFELSDAGRGEEEEAATASTATSSGRASEADEEPRLASPVQGPSGWLGRPLHFQNVIQTKTFLELAPTPRDHHAGQLLARTQSEPNIHEYAEKMPTPRTRDLQRHFSTKQASWPKDAPYAGALIVPTRVDEQGGLWEIPSATPMPAPSHAELA